MGVGGPTLCADLASRTDPTAVIGDGVLTNGTPSTSARPALGVTKPRAARIVVDFPAPFDPRKPVTLPSSAVKLALSSTVLRPKHLVRPLSLS